MDLQTIAFIVTGILTISITFLGVKHRLVKKALKETSDVLLVIVKANEDDKVTSEELSEIVKEIKEAGGAWANVFKKSGV